MSGIVFWLISFIGVFTFTIIPGVEIIHFIIMIQTIVSASIAMFLLGLSKGFKE